MKLIARWSGPLLFWGILVIRWPSVGWPCLAVFIGLKMVFPTLLDWYIRVVDDCD